MSRHRSPGRTAAPPPVPPVPAARSGAGHRVAPALRHALAAAAVTGGTLAVAVPVTTASAVVARDAGTLSLAADARPHPAPPSAPAAEPVRRLASVVPVGAVEEPEPTGFSVAGLLKSVGLADAARTQEQRTACDADLGGLGRVRPWVRDAARFLSCLYGEPELIGVAGRARHSDHPVGLAVDFMMRGERGDRLAACALANQGALGISYVIWEQRINFGDGWQRMEDRGGDTENHVDHVHVSFERRPGAGDPLAARCS